MDTGWRAIYVMLHDNPVNSIEQPTNGVGRMPTAYRSCLVLLVFSLTCESLSVFLYSTNPTAFSVQLTRALFITCIVGGVLIFSQIARYVGGIFIGFSAVYTVWGIYGAVKPPPLLIGTLIIAAAISELGASYLLCLSNSFRMEFANGIAVAPPIFQKLRRWSLVALATILAVYTIGDILHILGLTK